MGRGNREDFHREPGKITHSKRNNFETQNIQEDNASVITIYQQVVRNRIGKRGSSSSEEDIDMIDTSDEKFDECNNYTNLNPSINFINTVRRDYETQQARRATQSPEPEFVRQEQPMEDDRVTVPDKQRVRMTPEDRAEQLIREAEENKMKMYSTQGNQIEHNVINIKNNFVHSAMVDETYMMVASHLDDVTVQKIANGDYVDFAKILPKDRVRAEEEKMILKVGKTYYVPVNEGSGITGFNKWELAFRIYSNIYTQYHPQRASELIQYNHIIHMASLKYIWKNVYSYDRDFRIHMSKHTNRSWAIILQQSWTLRLQDKIRFSNEHHDHGSFHGKGNCRSSNNSEVCRKFNRGKCTYGVSCKYEHRCNYCFKYGHLAVTCRKAIADRAEKNGERNSSIISQPKDDK